MIRSACFPFLLCGPELRRLKDEPKSTSRRLSGVDISKIDLVEYLKTLGGGTDSIASTRYFFSPNSFLLYSYNKNGIINLQFA
jgi:hypothetical protein